MAHNKRTIWSIAKGIWIRILTIIIPFTFPAHITTFLHRLRGVKIGKGTKINRTAQIDDTFPDLVSIGDQVWITAGVIILCHQRDLNFYKVGKAVMECPLKSSEVIIKNGAHIGVGAIIMPGVTVGEGSIIGAGSVVTKDIPPYCVAAGAPAKLLRYLAK
jgi:acetyltransferase-like isoleucine patch superfamily enzyme